MKRISKAFTVFCLVIFSSFSIHAALITEWMFEINSGFTSYDPAASITTANTNAYWSAPSTLSWGSGGSGPSSLDVGGASNGYFSGNLFTNGAAVNTVTFTHTNNPITGTGLQSATLSDYLFLTPITPAGPGFAPPPLLFDILFVETTNGGTCAVASSPVPCNDIFVLDVAGAGFNPANNTLNQNFMYDGESYNARLFISGLGVLEDSACAAASAANGCIGFTTVENQVNTFQVGLDITTRQFEVPEPGVIVLLTIGLLSVFVGTRRKA